MKGEGFLNNTLLFLSCTELAHIRNSYCRLDTSFLKHVTFNEVSITFFSLLSFFLLLFLLLPLGIYRRFGGMKCQFFRVREQSNQANNQNK
jgi:hypothetical protein